MNLPNGLDREVRDEATHLAALGFTYEGIGRNGHLHFFHTDYGKTELPFSPSRKFKDAHRSEVARKMGISKQELELRLGLRQPKREGPKIRRERNEAGRRARRFEVVRDEPQQPVRIGSPRERREQAVKDRIAAEQRQYMAEPGTPAYNCALDDFKRCQREIMQLEAEERAA